MTPTAERFMSASILAGLEENLDQFLLHLQAITNKVFTIHDRNLRAFWCLYSFFLFQTRIATCAELRLKFFNPTSGINKLQLTSEERMADIADVKFYIRGGTSRRKGVPTTTFHCRFCVLWVNALFHRVHSFD
jgi:hypothetical protein